MPKVCRPRPERLILPLMLPPTCHDFKGSFRLDRANIRAFIAHHSDFDGKFVFSARRKELVLSAGDDRTHSQLTGSFTETITNNSVIAGFVRFEKLEDRMIFEIDGFSERFPRPQMRQRRQVINYISGLLRGQKYTFQIEENPNADLVALHCNNK